MIVTSPSAPRRRTSSPTAAVEHQQAPSATRKCWSIRSARTQPLARGPVVAVRVRLELNDTSAGAFGVLLDRLFDELEQARKLTACTNYAEDGNADQPLSPSVCSALAADWTNARDKLNKCIDATKDPKQSAGDQTCQSLRVSSRPTAPAQVGEHQLVSGAAVWWLTRRTVAVSSRRARTSSAHLRRPVPAVGRDGFHVVSCRRPGERRTAWLNTTVRRGRQLALVPRRAAGLIVRPRDRCANLAAQWPPTAHSTRRHRKQRRIGAGGPGSEATPSR